MSEDLIGRTLGSYQLTEQVGQGGMATVYKAYQPTMDRVVAIKVLPRALSHDPTFVGRFKQEAKVIAKLEHARILPVYDYGEEDGVIYIAMRYLNAGTLSERIEQGEIPLDDIARIITQIAEGLDYAHKRGVFHRDIKPSNILLDESDDAYITDFGIARMAEGSGQFTGSGIVGTPTYISPEQAMGNPVDGRTDVYSLGVVLYQMITGDVPYQAETPMGIVIKHINDPLPVPRSVKPDIPANVEAVLLKSLAKNPDTRYQSAGEMARELRAAVASPTAPAPAHVAVPVTATVGSLVGAFADHDTMPLNAPPADAGTIAAPPLTATPAPAKPKRRWLLPVGIVGGIVLLICGCLVLMSIANNRNGGNAGEVTPDEVLGQPTEPEVAALEPTEPPTGDAAILGFDGTPTCPSGFTQLQYFDFSAFPEGVEMVGSAHIEADQDSGILVIEAEGDDPSYMVFPPQVEDALLSTAFIMDEGAATIGLVLRGGAEDQGYAGILLADGTAVIMRNGEAVASAPAPENVFNGEPHLLMVRVTDSRVVLIIDSTRVATFDDPDPLPAGVMGFGGANGEVWIDGLLACEYVSDPTEPLLSENFESGVLETQWAWMNDPGEDHRALEDGRLRIDVLPATGADSGTIPVLTRAVPPQLDAHTIQFDVSLASTKGQAAGVALISRAGEVLATLLYGTRTTADGDVTGVFFDDWMASRVQGENYRGLSGGIGFFPEVATLRLTIQPGVIRGYFSYDRGATWESAGEWPIIETRIAKVGLITMGAESAEIIPAYFDNLVVYSGAVEP